jgi:hypothetical protein
VTITDPTPTVCGQPYRPGGYNTLQINGCQVTINARDVYRTDPDDPVLYDLGVSHWGRDYPDRCDRRKVPAEKVERFIIELTGHLNRRRRPFAVHGFDDEGQAFAVIRDRDHDPDVFTALAWAYMIDQEVGECCSIQPPEWRTYRCEQSYHNAGEYAWILTEREPGPFVWTGAIAYTVDHAEWWRWPARETVLTAREEYL